MDRGARVVVDERVAVGEGVGLGVADSVGVRVGGSAELVGSTAADGPDSSFTVALPVAANTTPIAAAATTTRPVAAKASRYRRQPIDPGRLSTCRSAMAPSFSMKNCSRPGLPVNSPSGLNEMVMT